MGELVDMGIDAAELEALARMPPQVLVDMRLIYEGGKPENSRQTALLKLMNESFSKFLSGLQAAEKDWRLAIAALDDPKRLGKVVGKDEGGDRAEDLIKELLEDLTREKAKDGVD